jgi:hypothetical protein
MPKSIALSGLSMVHPSTSILLNYSKMAALVATQHGRHILSMTGLSLSLTKCDASKYGYLTRFWSSIILMDISFV